MDASSASPRWPAWGHDHAWAWSLQSIDPLRGVTKAYLEKRHLYKVRILDSSMNLFKVSDVEVLGRAGILGWRPGFKGVYLRVEPKLQLERSLTLEAAKEYVVKFVLAHPRIYETAMPSAELTAAIMAAVSPTALLDLL